MKLTYWVTPIVATIQNIIIYQTELLRKIGICDKELESHNIKFPVIEVSIKYINLYLITISLLLKLHSLL